MNKLVAEFIGTFWLVLGGCGSAVLAAAFPDVGIGLLGVALAFGLTVLTMALGIGATTSIFSLVNGMRGWGYRASGEIRNAPVVGGDVGDPKLYFVTRSGLLTCIDAKTGERVWEKDLDAMLYASTTLAAILVGLVLVNAIGPGYVNGEPAKDLLALDASTAEFEERVAQLEAEVQLVEQRSLSTK